MRISRHCTLTTLEIMNVSLNQSFQILFNNFSVRVVRLLERMIISNCRTTPDSVHAVDFTDQKVFPTETPKTDDNPSNNLAELTLIDSAVHYKHNEDKKLQTVRHTVIQNENFSRLVQTWQKRFSVQESISHTVTNSSSC